MEEKKKSKAPLVIVLVLLFLFAVAGSSFGGYLFGKADGEKVEGKETTTSKELSETEVKSIMDRIQAMSDIIYESYPLNDVSDIPTQKIIELGLKGVGIPQSTTKELVERNVKYILGDNVDVNHGDYICTLENKPLYKYEDGYYSLNPDHPGHGKGNGYLVEVFFKKASIEGNELIIDTNILYTHASDTYGPTASYSDAIDENAKEVLKNIERTNVKKEYEKIKDTLPTTTFTFKRSELGGFNLETVVIK